VKPRKGGESTTEVGGLGLSLFRDLGVCVGSPRKKNLNVRELRAEHHDQHIVRGKLQ